MLAMLQDFQSILLGITMSASRTYSFSCFITLLALLVSTSSSSSATYYVATNGLDSNSGLATNLAWKTLAYATAHATNAGNTVLVSRGVYNQQVWMKQTNSAGQPITLMAYPGEHPVINLGGITPVDGKGAANWFAGVVTLSGNYNVIDGFEIENGNFNSPVGFGGSDVLVSGNNNIVRNCVVHNSQDAGIPVLGSYNLVESNQVYDTCLNHYHNLINGGSSDWGSGIPIHGYKNGSNFLTGNIIRGNTVHDNWGEGIYGYYGVSNTIVTGNTVYNCWTLNIGLANSYSGIISNNLSYYASVPIYMSGGATIVINIDGDTNDPGPINNLVVNNFAYGEPIIIQTYTSTLKGFTNTYVFFNTVVNTNGMAFEVGSTQIGLVIRNNIFDGTGSNSYYSAVAQADHNYWITRPRRADNTGYSNLSIPGTNDIFGEASAHMAQTPGMPLPGQLTREWFTLLTNSPAISNGVYLASVPTDAFGTVRGNPPDIGAYEATP